MTTDKLITIKIDGKSNIDLVTDHYVELCLLDAKNFLKSFFKKIYVEKVSKNYVSVTNFFEEVRLADGYATSWIDWNILNYFLKQKPNERILNSIFRAYYATEQFEKLESTSYVLNNQVNDTIYFRKFLDDKSLPLPSPIWQNIKSMVYAFATEFDLENNRIPKDLFKEKIKLYSDLIAYSNFIFLARISK